MTTTNTLDAGPPVRREVAGTGVVVRVLLRRHRTRLLAWILPILALLAVAAPSYLAYYPDLGGRAVLIEEMRLTATSRLMYGWVPLPGEIGQLLQWEIGTYVLLLAAVMSVLLAAAVGRGQEDDGLEEVVRSSGVGRASTVLAALVVVIGAAVALGAGAALVLAGQAAVYDELTVTGAVAFGIVIAVSAAAFGVLTLLAGEILSDAPGTRRAGLVALAVAFALRAVADTAEDEEALGVLRLMSPLGWRDVVAPYTDDRFGIALLLAAVVIAVAALVPLARNRREYGAGLLPARRRRARRARLRGPGGLALLLNRTAIVWWAAGILALAAFFGALSGSMVTIIESDPVAAELMTEMAGGEVGMAELYAEFMVVFVGLAAALLAVSLVLDLRRREETGLLDAELATGQRRWGPLAARVLLAAWATAVILAGAGAVMAALVQEGIGGDGTAALVFGFALQQWPAVFAVAGLAAALVGLVPRAASLVWVVPLYGLVWTMFGELFSMPSRAGALSVFGHGVDLTGDAGAAALPVALMCGVGLAGAASGVAGLARRDVG